MKTRLTTIAAACLTITACASPAPERVQGAASAPLVNTQWNLAQLGDQVISGSEGANAVGLKLDAQNPRVTGFGGCNRMFGGYLLKGDELKFDQVGATKMACLDQSRMRLEQSYFDMLSRVARWKITDSNLTLLDTAGATLGTFVASKATE